jgi:probable HAF family extracellular repeat protein
LGSDDGTVAVGINNLGQVVGTSAANTSAGVISLGFRTQPNQAIAPLTDNLGALGDGQSSIGNGINDAGQVVGQSTVPGLLAFQHAFRTAPNQPINPLTDDLGTLGGNSSFATAINNAGQVVGNSFTIDDSSQHAFRTAPNQAINPLTDDLGTLDSGGPLAPFGGDLSFATDINDLGQVVGGSSIAVTGEIHAFRTAPNQAINPLTDDLGTLGGSFSQANSINNLGQVVGFSTTATGDTQAFITGANQAINPLTSGLGTLGGSISIAYGINNFGYVVGYSATSTGDSSFLWSQWSGIVDLSALIDPALGWTLQTAYSINDKGQIVGFGYNQNPQQQAFLLTPDNNAPVAVNDAAALAAYTSTTIAVLANDSDLDSDPLKLTLISNPSNGTATVDDNGTPTDFTDDFIRYTPTPGFAGADSLTYQVDDGFGGVSTATVAIAVTGANLIGDNGPNTLIGTVLDDTLSGLGGNDVLDGKAGNDILTGGTDAGLVTTSTTSRSLGRSTDYSNNATGLTAFKNEWLVAATNQNVQLIGQPFQGAPVTYSVSNAPTTLSSTSTASYGEVSGIGVAGKYPEAPANVAPQISYNPNTQVSETLTVKWSTEVVETTVDLSRLVNKAVEGFGDEAGFVRAFRDGVEVDITGSRIGGSSSAIDNSALGVKFRADRRDGDFKMSLTGVFDTLVFSALPYDNPTQGYVKSAIKRDSSDYLLQKLDYQLLNVSLTIGDTLTGGAGADTFVFARGDGVDQITDFSAVDGDKVRLSGYSPSNLILQGTTALFQNGSSYEAIAAGNGYIWKASDFVFS